MLDVTLAGCAATLGLIVILFALDLFVSRPGHAHMVGFREAATASVFYVSVAIGFGIVFGSTAGWDFGVSTSQRRTRTVGWMRPRSAGSVRASGHTSAPMASTA